MILSTISLRKTNRDGHSIRQSCNRGVGSAVIGARETHFLPDVEKEQVSTTGS